MMASSVGQDVVELERFPQAKLKQKPPYFGKWRKRGCGFEVESVMEESSSRSVLSGLKEFIRSDLSTGAICRHSGLTGPLV